MEKHMDEIDCSKPEGNIFVIIRVVKSKLKDLGYNQKDIDDYVDGLFSTGSYEAVITKIETNLGNYISFINKPF